MKVEEKGGEESAWAWDFFTGKSCASKTNCTKCDQKKNPKQNQQIVLNVGRKIKKKKKTRRNV